MFVGGGGIRACMEYKGGAGRAEVGESALAHLVKAEQLELRRSASSNLSAGVCPLLSPQVFICK